MSMDHAPDLDWFVRERETPEYGIIYVASPYWSPDENVKRARAQAAQTATAKMIREGLPAFSPIVYSATMQAETGTNPGPGMVFLRPELPGPGQVDEGAGDTRMGAEPGGAHRAELRPGPGHAGGAAALGGHPEDARPPRDQDPGGGIGGGTERTGPGTGAGELGVHLQ